MPINLRNALMTGKRLPYDAEVEYLETDGSAYINTVAKIYNDTSVVVVWYSNYSTSTASYFFGSDSSTDRFYFREYNGNASYSIGSWWQNTNISTVGTHTIEMSNNGISVDGTASSRTGAAKTGDGNFCLFKVAAGNSPSGMRCYSCKIYQNGILVRDFIPVRKGTVGYLYDRVSGKLFGNAGTGDFVLGPDVVPVEYIESFRGSGGGQFLNTGIRATTSTKWEIDLAFTTTVTGQLMGSGHAGSQRFNIGIESSAFRGGFGGNWFSISNTRDTNRHLWRLESLSATQCEASIDGGAAVSYTSTFSPSPNSIFLGRRYMSESMTVGARYYANKIWTSGDLVQSLLPVRVGTDATSWEGAMMDVLTRRIYRNAGTGAFGYGNDLRYPIPAE